MINVEGTSPLMGGAFPEQVVPGSIRKVNEQAMGLKIVSNIPQQSLVQPLLSGSWLSSCSDFPHCSAVIEMDMPNELFPVQIALDHGINYRKRNQRWIYRYMRNLVGSTNIMGKVRGGQILVIMLIVYMYYVLKRLACIHFSSTC